MATKNWANKWQQSALMDGTGAVGPPHYSIDDNEQKTEDLYPCCTICRYRSIETKRQIDRQESTLDDGSEMIEFSSVTYPPLCADRGTIGESISGQNSSQHSTYNEHIHRYHRHQNRPHHKLLLLILLILPPLMTLTLFVSILHTWTMISAITFTIMASLMLACPILHHTVEYIYSSARRAINQWCTQSITLGRHRNTTITIKTTIHRSKTPPPYYLVFALIYLIISFDVSMVDSVTYSNGMANAVKHRAPKRSSPGSSSRAPTTPNFTYFEERDDKIQFSNMAVNVYNGYIYVGATNTIYQLKLNQSQLMVEAKAIMGPNDDHTSSSMSHDDQQSSSIYWNKALVVDNQHSWLISCGTTNQGSCVAHQWNNVSNIVHQPIESVVANNATASTVAFIAPGPPPHKQVLYVGTTFTQGRTDVPAVSSRSLFEGNLFQLASVTVSSGTRLLVNSLVRKRYPINYVYGFQSRNFSYFLTVQKTQAEGQNAKPYISKLVRICQKDPNYYSYTEVPLVCRSSHVKYNLAQAAYIGKPGAELAKSFGITPEDDLLYVVFSKSREEYENSTPSNQSALCVYSLMNVHRLFTQNIQHCFNGNGDQGLDFINIKQKCVSTQVQINEDFCGMDVNQLLGGINPIETEPAITYDNVHLTSVAATSIHDFTVAFLGTSTGHLKKVVIEQPKYEAYEFSDLVVQHGSPINSDMHFNSYDKSLYVMTTRRVTLVKVQECHAYRTCMECLGARNPYCGWCSLENKCSLRSVCGGGTSDPLYWLSYKSGKCTTITSVNPAQIQRTTIRTLNLIIDNLPALDGRLLCVFTTNGKVQVTNATRSNNGVSCPTPTTDTLPPIPDGHHSFTSKLSVRMKDGPDFVATNFTFYDCQSYTSCTACVSSLFPCDWCVGGHRCTHDTGENCRNEILITGIKSVGPSIRSGPNFCPRINSTVGGTTQVLVPSGSTKRISVRVVNIPQASMSIRFVCQFNIEGRVRQVNAQLLTDTIYCEPLQFSYVTNQTNITATFAVIWDGNKPLDNPDNIHVLVYRCSWLANNCGACLELDERYLCGWCQQGERCEVSEHCLASSSSSTSLMGLGHSSSAIASTSSVWLNRQQICPNPHVIDFYPKSGPLEGGTNLTIDGINLGRTFEDIENGVGIVHEINGKQVAFIPCHPYAEEYVKTSRIKCRIQNPRNISLPASSPHQFMIISGPVMVRVQTEFTAKSRDVFNFVNPKILSLNPSKGPVSGGTTLMIEGLHMDAGSRAVAYLGSLPCNVTRRTMNNAECITSARDAPGDEQAKVIFDNGVRNFDYYRFLYVEDPVILSVESGSSGIWRNTARGIPSGGLRITVRGKNLNIVQRPQMYVTYENVDYVSNCTINSGEEMRCYSPPMPPELLAFARPDSEYMELDFGFIMDGVRSVRQLATRKERPFPKFRMFRSPEFQLFPEPNGIKYYRSEYLTINARYMKGVISDDISVWIGASICNVTAMSPIQLTCRLPNEQPPAEEDNYSSVTYDKLPAVIVGVGSHLNVTLGYLSYNTSPTTGSFFSFSNSDNMYKQLFILIMFGICLLFVVVVIILILYRRKSTESSRVLKTMQEQMDVLELRVASEAKEAFAELQTEITDITAEINVGGIPFLDYRIYTLKVLFPNADDHAVLQELTLEPSERPNVEKALHMFGQLIMNKTFLLLFIRTLESNRYFSMRDRVNVASLIMVSLQGRMEYCTSILKTLLAELIEKCIDGKSHPKLLLRRTESVAEKMLSSWFTFLLYKFLKECAGEPLYLLYFAIKHQVEKGPVDEYTYEARYSLSEEKLIRQQIDYKSMTVNVNIQNAYAPNYYGMMNAYEQPAQYGHLTGTATNATGTMHQMYGQAPVYSSLPSSEYLEFPVKVLDCDTISQVKEKALDTIYRGVPFSQRPFREDELDLEWRTGTTGKLTLSNDDQTSRVNGEWRRVNTLAHYKVPDNAALILVPNSKQATLLYNTIDYMSIAGAVENKMATLGGVSSSSSSGFAEKHRYEPLHHFKGLHGAGGGGGGSSGCSPPSSLSRPTSPPVHGHHQSHHHHPHHHSQQQHNNHHHHHETENGYQQRMWHLVKHHDSDGGHGKEHDRGNKMVSEIYLTRLLATKGTLQKYVDDLFETIFSTRDENRGSSLPLAIKYMFDFLDDQARYHSVHDCEVVHTWKSNSLPLRFWVNLIKNPNFVFDINKSNIVDSCLSVVAQTFMDACSTSDHRLGKDSPSSKLLYAKDIPIYKEWVERYYKEIETMPAISDQDMNAMLAEESRQHAHEFNTNVALHELYKYAFKYKDQLMQTLNDDEFSVKNNLQLKLANVYETMVGKPCYE
ncbi:hypothetical protein BLOT_012695 [Blomia tropicalis]|nr:hypothetical protein BLOT_012695 [Blomia tropicalis]